MERGETRGLQRTCFAGILIQNSKDGDEQLIAQDQSFPMWFFLQGTEDGLVSRIAQDPPEC